MSDDFTYVKMILKDHLLPEGASPKECREKTKGFNLSEEHQEVIDNILDSYEEWWDEQGEELCEERAFLIKLVRDNPDKDPVQAWDRIDEIEEVIESKIKEFLG